MHPAKSVIYFTTATGAGYGLLVWLAIFAWGNILPADKLFGFVSFGLAFFLVGSGLLSSTLHLGHPERAWRALSQWRSSWLSREGVIALLTFVPTGLFALGWVFQGQNGGLLGALGLMGAAMSLLTVFCTSMIYVSLKAIPAWNNRWVSLGYLVLSLATGALLLALLMAGLKLPGLEKALLAGLVFISLGLGIKLAYWLSLSTDAPRSTSGSATGLGAFGTVSLIDAPHTESNYLLEEMGFQIARKHRKKLRNITIFMGFIFPAVALSAEFLVAESPTLLVLTLAVLSCAAGIIAERWLFFAEAQHVVMLYYGTERV